MVHYCSLYLRCPACPDRVSRERGAYSARARARSVWAQAPRPPACAAAAAQSRLASTLIQSRSRAASPDSTAARSSALSRLTQFYTRYQYTLQYPRRGYSRMTYSCMTQSHV